METVIKTCKACKKDFETVTWPSTAKCKKCIALNAKEKYFKNRENTICECGKCILTCNYKKHLTTNLHKNWLRIKNKDP